MYDCSCRVFLSISMVIPVIVLYYVIKVAVKNAIKELKRMKEYYEHRQRQL